VCGLALSCWNNSLCRSITCMRWGWRISSLYLIAVTLPGTCTRSVLRSFVIPTHIMTLPPPKLSTSWEEKRSFRRLYTRILPSPFCSRKRDSSLNQILRQFRNVQPLNLLHTRTLSRLCNGVNTAPKYGILGLNAMLSKPVVDCLWADSSQSRYSGCSGWCGNGSIP
jgi:hypothetical protein